MAAGRLTGSPFGKFVDGCRREVDVKLASLGCEVTRPRRSTTGGWRPC